MVRLNFWRVSVVQLRLTFITLINRRENRRFSTKKTKKNITIQKKKKLIRFVDFKEALSRVVEDIKKTIGNGRKILKNDQFITDN